VLGCFLSKSANAAQEFVEDLSWDDYAVGNHNR